jgi:hypothetical protein
MDEEFYKLQAMRASSRSGRQVRLGQRENLEFGIEVQFAGAAARRLDGGVDLPLSAHVGSLNRFDIAMPALDASLFTQKSAPRSCS